VILSNSESEYVVTFETVKDLTLMYFLLHDIGVDVDLPVVMKTDNIYCAGVCIRHVDTWYHFTRERIEEEIIKIKVFRSSDNKYINQGTYKWHMKSSLFERFRIGDRKGIENEINPYAQVIWSKF
jgi:hypothetical protein